MSGHIRRVAYNHNGNTMVFSHGQEINGIFRIVKIKEGFEGINYFVDIFISPLNNGRVFTKWKRIVNGVSPIEYNVDFLCKVDQ